jgi:hypothetical protein
LFKKTANIASRISNFSLVKEKDFICLAYIRAKAIRVISRKPIEDLVSILDIIEGDTVKIKPIPYNKKLYNLFLVNRKTRYC